MHIQKYLKGGHFNSMHSERMGIESSSRLFAWMTYLNDVNHGGETEFLYYNEKIKPIPWANLLGGPGTNFSLKFNLGTINFVTKSAAKPIDVVNCVKKIGFNRFFTSSTDASFEEKSSTALRL